LTDHQKFVASDYVGNPYGCATFGENPSLGLLGERVKYNEFLFFFIYTFFGKSPTGQTCRRIFTLDDSNDADSSKGVPFWCFVDIAPHFRGEIPPPQKKNPNFWVVNRRFQAKRGKY